MEKDKARLVLILASSAAGGSNLPSVIPDPHAYQSSQWLKLKTDLSTCSSHINKKRVGY
jgi:hypothetical protein